jgi:hypothetical protein
MMMDNDFPIVRETSNPRSPYDIYKRPDDSDKKYGPPPEGFERPTPVKNAEAIEYLNNYKNQMFANQAPMSDEQPGYGPAAPDSMFRDILERKYPGTLERMDRIREQLRRGTFPFV